MDNKKHSMDSKKHNMNEEPEEYVQVVFTNLIKKCKTNNYKEPEPIPAPDSICKFQPSGIIVNSHTYHFNLKSLIEKEPTNNLLNIHSGEIKKRVNEDNHTIEYMEYLPDFNLIIDYINGYNYKNFNKVFKTEYSRYERFHLLLTKLGMTNLIAKLELLYPLLNINGSVRTFSTGFISTIEPYNHLFDSSSRQLGNKYSHFRDNELFNTYFRDYLLGKKTLIEAAEYINILKQKQTQKQVEISNIEDYGYTLAKIESDLYYYGLSQLREQVFG